MVEAHPGYATGVRTATDVLGAALSFIQGSPVEISDEGISPGDMKLQQGLRYVGRILTIRPTPCLIDTINSPPATYPMDKAGDYGTLFRSVRALLLAGFVFAS